MLLLLLIITPLAAAIATFAIRRNRMWVEMIAAVAAPTELVAALLAIADVYFYGNYDFGGFLSLDALGAVVAIAVVIVGAGAAIYSIGYLRDEMRKRIVGFQQVKRYFYLFHLFLMAMFLAITTVNPIIMWIAIEATTLATAFLISFYGKPSSIEGAWKYLILNSIGLLLGFFGTLLFLTGAIDAGPDQLVDWQMLTATTAHLDPLIIKIAFIFVLIGYGTKIGFVPMHTWLPDAYSKAPSPVSAVLSGALSNVAILAVIRFKIASDKAIGAEFSGNLLLLFGVASIVVAALLISLQKNYKRLFAYSSIEHVGIIALGLGFGGIGYFAALLHMLYHALTKTGLFFAAGNILLKYASTKIARVAGVRTALPVTAVLLFLGVLAITGVPPFGTFLTEVYILSAGIGNHVAIVAVVLAMLALVFIGFLRHIIGMVFGQPDESIKAGESTPLTTVPPFAILALLIVFSVYLPTPLKELLESAAALLH
jgi:hydrogenase-4 component F